MVSCLRCGAEMIEGEAYIRVTISENPLSSGFSIMPMLGTNTQSRVTNIEEGLLWKEKTGKTRGWLIKSEEEKSLKISGLRCIECGHIELCAKD